MFAIDDNNFLNLQDHFQNCSYPQYPLLINEDKSDVLNASSMDIKSNGEMYLNGNVFIGLNEAKLNADCPTFKKKQIKSLVKRVVLHEQELL